MDLVASFSYNFLFYSYFQLTLKNINKIRRRDVDGAADATVLSALGGREGCGGCPGLAGRRLPQPPGEAADV